MKPFTAGVSVFLGLSLGLVISGPAAAQPTPPTDTDPDATGEPDTDARTAPAPDPGDRPRTSLDASGDDDPETDDPSQPWHRGISAQDKKRAQALYEAGNALNDRWHESYDNELLVDAARLYQEALGHWQHPSIQLNLAHTLILLHREAAAYENLVMAVRYGPEPLESPEDHRWALAQIERLEALLAVLDIRTYQPDVRIALDGVVLFLGPRTVKKYLVPGDHTLVASKDGFLTETVTLDLESGETKIVLFSLVDWQETTISRRPWPLWKPWTTIGTGVFLASAGGLLRWRAGAEYQRFDREFTAWCQMPGCTDTSIPASIDSIRTKARWQNRLGMGAMVTGGALAIIGTAWLILDQPENVTVRDPGVLIAPLLTESGGGIVSSWLF